MSTYIRLFFLLILINMDSMGQDIQLSQFYSASLYLNPAFAGGVNSTRVSAHQRLQWPRLDAKYVTSMLSFDTYSHKHKSGLGMMIVQDNQGSGTLNSTSLALQYSYLIYLNHAWSVRTGLEMNLASRVLDLNKLQFTSQFDNTGLVSNTNPYGDYSRIRKYYTDISSGMILYSKAFWFGFSAHHMNMPNQSMIGGVARLPAKFTFISGYKINLSNTDAKDYRDGAQEEFSLTPTIHYKFQGKSDQLDIGIYGIHNRIILGLWYRGIPVKKYDVKFQNNESMTALAGIKIGSAFSVTYSYDYTLSRLAPARTGGAHELNITYIHKKHIFSKPTRRQPCPHFNNH
jgi:type IX secretion system PorP/SprF family membrane protein